MGGAGGLGLGQGVMESFDVGGIFSLYVAVFVLMAAYNRNETERGAWGLATAKGVGLVVVLAVASALMAGHALSNLLKTEGKAAAAQQQRMTDQQQWDFATQWSLPKAETARLAVPGLFGYRLDSAEGARYWGAVGQSPGWHRASRIAAAFGLRHLCGIARAVGRPLGVGAGGFGIGRAIGNS